MKVVSAHFNLLPYHAARYEAFVRCHGAGYQLVSVLFRTTEEYKLINQARDQGNRFEVLRPDLDESLSKGARRQEIWEILDHLEGDVFLLPGGYAEFEMQCVMLYGAERGIPMILCSATKEDDARRVWWREFVKRQILQLSSSFLVGGRSQKMYLEKLGVDSSDVHLGYNAVDNDYYSRVSEEVLSDAVRIRQRLQLPEKYFVTSVRFVPVKNLVRLLQAYRAYRETASDPWHLVILGDGEMRVELEAIRESMDLEECVHMPGFKQYDELPLYYTLAHALVLPSTKEPWGLVVNEAMACSLPVLVSEVCGCAPELVSDGVNGYTFNPWKVSELVEALQKISSPEISVNSFGVASKEQIANWGPPRFADGLRDAVDQAVRNGPRRRALLGRLFLRALLLR